MKTDTKLFKAIEQGIDKMLLPNINSETIEAMHQLCQDFPTTMLSNDGAAPMRCQRQL